MRGPSQPTGFPPRNAPRHPLTPSPGKKTLKRQDPSRSLRSFQNLNPIEATGFCSRASTLEPGPRRAWPRSRHPPPVLRSRPSPRQLLCRQQFSKYSEPGRPSDHRQAGAGSQEELVDAASPAPPSPPPQQPGRLPPGRSPQTVPLSCAAVPPGAMRTPPFISGPSGDRPLPSML